MKFIRLTFSWFLIGAKFFPTVVIPSSEDLTLLLNLSLVLDDLSVSVLCAKTKTLRLKTF